jgi:hypothetical protein
VSGATAFLDRVSVWRFLSPPSALLTGVLTDRAGRRICDESRNGAAVGDAIIRHGGRAWLLVDSGLSLADCVFSGRRAARSAAAAQPSAAPPRQEPPPGP